MHDKLHRTNPYTPNPQGEARALLDRYWSDRPMPVDPVTIADKLGARVLKTKLEGGVAGVLLKQPGEDPRILVEMRDSDNRRRLTVARGLGYFVYRGATEYEDEDSYQILLQRSPPQTGEERFAERFAVELLLPASVVRNATKRYGLLSGALGAAFGVPQEAISKRLRELKLMHRQVHSA